MNLDEAKAALTQLLAEAHDPYDEQSVVLGSVDGAEICLMGWRERPIKDVTAVTTHANPADSMQIMLEGSMEIFYPDERRRVTLQAGDCHVVLGGREHACVSNQKSMVLVVVGNRANQRTKKDDTEE